MQIRAQVQSTVKVDNTNNSDIRSNNNSDYSLLKISRKRQRQHTDVMNGHTQQSEYEPYASSTDELHGRNMSMGQPTTHRSPPSNESNMNQHPTTSAASSATTSDTAGTAEYEARLSRADSAQTLASLSSLSIPVISSNGFRWPASSGHMAASNSPALRAAIMGQTLIPSINLVPAAASGPSSNTNASSSHMYQRRNTGNIYGDPGSATALHHLASTSTQASELPAPFPTNVGANTHNSTTSSASAEARFNLVLREEGLKWGSIVSTVLTKLVGPETGKAEGAMAEKASMGVFLMMQEELFAKVKTICELQTETMSQKSEIQTLKAQVHDMQQQQQQLQQQQQQQQQHMQLNLQSSRPRGFSAVDLGSAGLNVNDNNSMTAEYLSSLSRQISGSLFTLQSQDAQQHQYINSNNQPRRNRLVRMQSSQMSEFLFHPGFGVLPQAPLAPMASHSQQQSVLSDTPTNCFSPPLDISPTPLESDPRHNSAAAAAASTQEYRENLHEQRFIISPSSESRPSSGMASNCTDTTNNSTASTGATGEGGGAPVSGTRKVAKPKKTKVKTKDLEADKKMGSKRALSGAAVGAGSLAGGKRRKKKSLGEVSGSLDYTNADKTRIKSNEITGAAAAYGSHMLRRRASAVLPTSPISPASSSASSSISLAAAEHLVKTESYTDGGDSTHLGKRWTDAQDDALRTGVAVHGARSWKIIADMVPGRDHVQCLQRWKKVLRPGLRKGPWGADEDEMLMSLVRDEKAQNWANVAERVPGRTAKQCRERWCLNLDPSINREKWTSEEDKLLLELHANIGNKWAEIKTQMKGRTENGVKTRYKSLLRLKKKEWTREQDEELLSLFKVHGRDWTKISDAIPQRTKNAIKIRFKMIGWTATAEGNDSVTASEPV